MNAKSSRNSKGSKSGTGRTSTSQSGSQTTAVKPNQKDTETTKTATVNKIAPTAEQLRIAHMIENSNTSEQALQEKISQVTQVTGVSTDDAIVALHDCNNDINAAIDALLEGDDQGEWKESTKKKKKPATKVRETRDEAESNKENRRMDNRDKHSSKPRGGGSRHRGGGRGGSRQGKDDGGESSGVGRGRKPSRMANGSTGSYRGRGGRGRGGSCRTFQNRQPSGFTETIDTWGAPEKETNSASNLQIDTWDETWDYEPAAASEDWDNEWTGSLDKTTVFGPSGASDSPEGASTNDQMTSGPKESLDSAGNSAESSASLGDSINSLAGMPQRMGSAQPTPTSKSYGAAVSNTPTISQKSDMDFALLLQKAAPHSTLSRLPPSDNPQVPPQTMMGIPTEDTTKTGYAGAAMSIPSKAYTNEQTSSASRFSNSALASSGDMKNLAARSKPQPRKPAQPSSKIPATAVEMPANAMLDLEIDFGGLEFGTESFDFGDVKTMPSNNMVPSMAQREAQSVPAMPKDLGNMPSIPQQSTLVPEPIPFPSQNTERKATSGTMMSSQRGAPSSASTGANYSELKKDASMGALVGSTAPTSLYQPSSSFTSKSTSSFPSPPSAHFAQNSSQTYSSNSSSGATGNSYSGPPNNKAASNAANNGSSSSGGSYSSSYAAHGTSGSAQYQNNYVHSSSHSTLASINVPPTLSGLKESAQSMQSYESTSNSAPMAGSMATSSAASVNSSSAPMIPTTNAGQAKSSAQGKNGSTSATVPPGVSHLPGQTQPILPHQVGQGHHQLHQPLAQQTPQNQQMMAGASQYMPPPTAPLQGSLPAFYNVQPPAMYSFEDLQMFQQRIPQMQQPPTTLPRDASITSPAAYTGADANKFRNDQNSSPVPSTINQQGGAPGATYITAAHNNNMMQPLYMYHHNMVPNSFPQYGHPTIIQIPPNSHTGTSSTQYPPGPPKVAGYVGTSNYSYDNMSQQSQDYKSGYGSTSQGQSKAGGNAPSGPSNAGSELSGYKNHLNKVGRSYDKQSFHSGTPPPFNLPGSAASNPMTANAYGPAMFFSTVPATAQHHSPLMHHQLHQDGASGNSQRSGVGSSQNKGSSKGFTNYWGN